MKFVTPIVLAFGLVLALAAPASARECEGIRMANTVEVNGTTLTLNGMGIREATVFNVNVYVAGLYVETRSRNGNAIASSDTHRRLDLRFVRDVERSDIAEAFREGFGSAGAHSAALNRLIGWMADMSEGGRLTFTYTPGTGLEVKVGSRVRGTIEGAAFAQRFFSIWLGANPPNAGLKSGLLGGSCG